MNGKIFTGPLFIIGLSRSGTTLIRALLNLHDQIALPRGESHFIPMLVRRFGEDPDFSNPVIREKVLDIVCDSIFAGLMRNHGIELHRDSLLETAFDNGWCGFLEAFFRQCGEEPIGPDAIWGDKTPRNLVHARMLKRICPDARFLHIIRDVRDRCLSVKNMWHKGLYRAAIQWEEEMEMSRSYATEFGADYMEIRYEALLADPRDVLTSVCAFLGITFQEHMTQLKRPVQLFGDARGKSEIVQNNMNKFADRIPAKKLKRIEEIAYPMMLELGYKPLYADRHVPVGTFYRNLLVSMDRLMLLRWYHKRQGIVGGIKRAIKTFLSDVWFGGATKGGSP